MRGLKRWLASDEIVSLSTKPDWPTPESHALWCEFNNPDGAQVTQTWNATKYTSNLIWSGAPMSPGTPLRLGGGPGKERRVFTADFQEVGMLAWTPSAKGLIVATVVTGIGKVNLEYLGPGKVIRD